MAQADTDQLLSISDANRMGVSGLIRAAEEGETRVVLRNNKPVAVVLSMARYDELEQSHAAAIDAAIAAARMLTAGESRHALDDVLAQFGYSRETLRQLPDA